MSIKNIKDKIKIAREAVQGEEEPYKTVAFQVILGRLLDSDQREPAHFKTQSAKTITMSPKTTVHTGDPEKGKEELAKNCGITVKELDDVVSIKNDVIQVIYPLTGKESDKQIIAAQCIMVTYDSLFDKESVDSSLLRKCIDYSGVGSLNHLAENLKENSNLFRAAGKGTRLDYRLTGPGRKSAFGMIRRLAKGENPLELESQ